MKIFTHSPPKRRNGLQALVLSALLSASVGAQAAIGETSSDVTISNTATLNYSVGGTAQAAIGSSEAGNTSGAGTATTFKVDNKVNLTLTEGNTTFTSVSPAALNQITGFVLTNTGNTAQGYNLTAANSTGTVFGLADAFDVSDFLIYVDSNQDGILQAGELAAGAITSVASLARDTSVFLLVSADIPAAQANGTQSVISLTALARTETTLTALTEAANTQAGVEIVFADTATTANASGTDPGQIARDAQAIAKDAYRVAAAIISVSKTATLICDPFNGTTTPKNIPGAIVRWTITVSNSASASSSATLATIGDTLDTNTLHDANLVLGTGGVPATTCSSTTGTAESLAGRGFQIESNIAGRTLGGAGATGYMTNVADADGATIAGAAVTIDFATALPLSGVTHTAGELKPGESATVTFNVTVK